jgi:hypothetical protein
MSLNGVYSAPSCSAMKVVTGTDLRQLNDKAWERKYATALSPTAFITDDGRPVTGRINLAGMHIVICRGFRHGVGSDGTVYHRCTVVAAMIELPGAPQLTVDIAESDYEELCQFNALSPQEFTKVVQANVPQDPEALKKAIHEALAEFVLA